MKRREEKRREELNTKMEEGDKEIREDGERRLIVMKRGGGDLGLHGLDLVQADLRVVAGGTRAEAALGQAALQRHLAALKANLVKTTGAALLALVATAGCFAKAGADATTHALAVFLAARCGAEFVQFHRRTFLKNMGSESIFSDTHSGSRKIEPEN